MGDSRPHPAANWRVFQKTGLATSFVYQHGSQVIAGGETFEQYGPQISLSRGLTRKLSGSVAYQFYVRNSDFVGRDHTVHIVSLNATYQL